MRDILDIREIDLGIRTGISGIIFDIISALGKTFLNIVFLIVNLGCSFVLNLMHLAVVWLVKRVNVNFAIDETFFTNSATQFGNIINVFKDTTQIIGLSIILLIVMWQLFKIFFQSANLETDDPLKLGVRLIIYGILVGKSYDIIKYIITSVYTPIVNILLTLIYDSDIIGLNNDMSLTKVVSAILSNLTTVLKLDSTAIEGLGNFALLIQSLVLLYIDLNIVLVIIKFAERAVTLFLLTLISPLAFACGVAKTTKYIFEGWVKSFCGVLIIYFVYNLALVMVILFLYLHEGGLLVIDGLYVGFDGNRSFIFSAGILLGLLSLMDQVEMLAREMGFGTGGSTMTVYQGQGLVNQIKGSAGIVKMTAMYAGSAGVLAGKYAGKGYRKFNRWNELRRDKNISKEKDKVEIYKKGLKEDPNSQEYKNKLKQHEDKLNKFEAKKQDKIDDLKQKKEKYEKALRNGNLSQKSMLSIKSRLKAVNDKLDEAGITEDMNVKKSVGKGFKEGLKLENIKNGIDKKKAQIDDLKRDEKGDKLREEKENLLYAEQQQLRRVMDSRLSMKERNEAIRNLAQISRDIRNKDKEITEHDNSVENKIKLLQKDIVSDATKVMSARGNIERNAKKEIGKFNDKIKSYDKDIANLDKKIYKALSEGKDIKALEDKKNVLMAKKKMAEDNKNKYHKRIEDYRLTDDEKKTGKFKYKMKSKIGRTFNENNIRNWFDKNKKGIALKSMGIMLELGGVKNSEEILGRVVDIAPKILKIRKQINSSLEVGENTLNLVKAPFKVAKYAVWDHKGNVVSMAKDLKTNIEDIPMKTYPSLKAMDLGREDTERMYNRYMENKYRIEDNQIKIEELEREKEGFAYGTKGYDKIQHKIDLYRKDVEKCNKKNESYARKAGAKAKQYLGSMSELEDTIESRVGSYKELQEKGYDKYSNSISNRKDSVVGGNSDVLSDNRGIRNLQRKHRDMQYKVDRLMKIVEDNANMNISRPNKSQQDVANKREGMTFVVGGDGSNFNDNNYNNNSYGVSGNSSNEFTSRQSNRPKDTAHDVRHGNENISNNDGSTSSDNSNSDYNMSNYDINKSINRPKNTSHDVEQSSENNNSDYSNNYNNNYNESEFTNESRRKQTSKTKNRTRSDRQDDKSDNNKSDSGNSANSGDNSSSSKKSSKKRKNKGKGPSTEEGVTFIYENDESSE